MPITKELLRRCNVFYDDGLITSLVPEAGLTPLEFADRDDIPVDDRIAVLLRPEVLGKGLQKVLTQIVDEAIRSAIGRSGVPLWESWAQAWLAGDTSMHDVFFKRVADAATDSAASHVWAARAAWATWAARASVAARNADNDFMVIKSAHNVAKDAAWSASDAAWSDSDEAVDSTAYSAARRSQLAHIRASLA